MPELFALFDQLRLIMESKNYKLPPEQAEAILLFIWDRHVPEKYRLPLFSYFLVNYDHKNIGKTDEWSGTTGLNIEKSVEIVAEILPRLQKEYEVLFKNNATAEEVALWLINEIESAPDREHKIMIITIAMMDDITPYAFYEPQTDVSEDEWSKLYDKHTETISFLKSALGSGKFRKRTDLGSLLDELLKNHDAKTRAFLLAMIVTLAKLNAPKIEVTAILGQLPEADG